MLIRIFYAHFKQFCILMLLKRFCYDEANQNCIGFNLTLLLSVHDITYIFTLVF